MPGQGKIVAREYSASERATLGEDRVLHALGETTRDIYLNETAFWQNDPSRVWEYSLGGYQVIKKWLSYRDARVLGRALKAAEIEEVMNMSRRIAALLLMETELDANYRVCCVVETMDEKA